MSTTTILWLTIILAVLIGLLFALMFNYYFLLKRIARRFPVYYSKLGSPFLPTASWAITKTIKRDTANYRLLNQLLKGVPDDFPKDAYLVRLAHYLQLEMIVIGLLFLAGLGFVY